MELRMMVAESPAPVRGAPRALSSTRASRASCTRSAVFYLAPAATERALEHDVDRAWRRDCYSCRCRHHAVRESTPLERATARAAGEDCQLRIVPAHRNHVERDAQCSQLPCRCKPAYWQQAQWHQLVRIHCMGCTSTMAYRKIMYFLVLFTLGIPVLFFSCFFQPMAWPAEPRDHTTADETVRRQSPRQTPAPRRGPRAARHAACSWLHLAPQSRSIKRLVSLSRVWGDML